jgi:hypothetical protein
MVQRYSCANSESSPLGRDEFTRTLEPARALAAEVIKRERLPRTRNADGRMQSAYGLTPAETELPRCAALCEWKIVVGSVTRLS